ncbi:hypothetical protein [Natronoglycomyces albus]|uniref:Uncharacterized protein n=1 Tax=Natronoglycomyces albus TaxID=2811108 RepID=A0A895XQ35_9ACTN|nr:hypothetical protein [Natronoglycomyces albus]QSB05653.1 hypothetical protein JQS30_01615 [Natronoglycomyces albus]
MTQPSDPQPGGQYWEPSEPSQAAGEQTQRLTGAPAEPPFVAPVGGPTPPPPNLGASAVAGTSTMPAAQSPIDPFATSPQASEESAPGRSRDRMGFTLIWEGILLLLSLGALAAVIFTVDDVFPAGARFDEAANVIVPFLLMALGLGLSLRLGAPNFGIPVFVIVGAWAVGIGVGENLLLDVGVLVGIALVSTVLIVILTVALRQQPWIVTLAVALLMFAIVAAWAESLSGLSNHVPTVSGFTLTPWIALVAAVALAVIGGLLGCLTAMRERFTKVSSMLKGECPRSASLVSFYGLCTFISITLVFAAVVLSQALPQGEYGGLWAVWAPETGFSAVFALGALTLFMMVLVIVTWGGTSLNGRRGGIAGTALAAILVFAIFLLVESAMYGQRPNGLEMLLEPVMFLGTDASNISFLLLALMLVLGLFISWMVDRWGQPRTPVTEGDPVEFPPQPAQDSAESDADLGIFGEPNRDPDAHMFPNR